MYSHDTTLGRVLSAIGINLVMLELRAAVCVEDIRLTHTCCLALEDVRLLSTTDFESTLHA